MSTDTPTREVFTDVEPDPDAVLSGFGVESPDEILASADDPDDEPTAAEELEACDDVAAALFDDLESVPLESAEQSASAAVSATDPAADLADDVFVSEPTVVVAEDDGASIDALFDAGSESGSESAPASPSDAPSSPEDSSTAGGDEWGGLVGPDPEPVRVAEDSFGGTAPEPVTDGGFVVAEPDVNGGSRAPRGGFRWVEPTRLGDRPDSQ